METLDNLSMDNFLFGDVGSPTHNEENYQKGLANKIFSEKSRKKKIKDKKRGILEEESLKKVYSSFIKLNQWKIRNHPVSTKSFLGSAFSQIFDKSGKEIWIKDADADDLEKFCLYKFIAYGWSIPSDYQEWKD